MKPAVLVLLAMGVGLLHRPTAVQGITPAPVSKQSDTVTFTAMSVGGIHTCAVATGGVAYCWGWNSRGQLGDGTSGNERRTRRPSRATCASQR